MSEPVYPALLGLTPSERATLDEAIRLSRGNPAPVPDDCNRCGGLHCDECSGPVDPYVPEYVRASIKKWRPAE